MTDRDLEHRAISLYVLAMLSLVLCALLARPLEGQERSDLALSDVAADQLVRYWQRPVGDSLACLSGHRTVDGMIVLDSARLARQCDFAFGAAVFVHTPLKPGEEMQAIVNLMAVLSQAPVWQFLAAVYGTAPTVTHTGRRATMPQMLYAYRRREVPLSPSPRGEM